MKRLWLVLVLAGCATGGGYRPVAVTAGGLAVEMVPRQELGYVLLEVTVRNGDDGEAVFDLEDVVVLDGDGLVMRRMDPGEAADMRLQNVRGAPRYPRKWEVRVEPDKVVVEEVTAPEGFAEGFARGFAESAARYHVSQADEMYRNGLALRTVVPGGAGVRGWAYYLGRGAVEVRVGGERVRVR